MIARLWTGVVATPDRDAYEARLTAAPALTHDTVHQPPPGDRTTEEHR